MPEPSFCGHRFRRRENSAQSDSVNGRNTRFNYWTMVDPKAAKDETGEIMLSFLQDLDEQSLHVLRKEVIEHTREVLEEVGDDELSDAEGYRRLAQLIVVDKTRGQTRKYDSTC